MHGGTNPGAPSGPSNGNYRHGLRTRDMEAAKREMAVLAKAWRDLGRQMIE